MKKVIIFGLVIIVIFGALAFVTSYQNKQQSAGNPFGKDRIAQSTINQLDDPLYQNIILPEELDEKLEAGESLTVYFYSPECEQCNLATPILMPVAEELGVEVYLYSVLEFTQGWDDYDIEGTPTLIHFEDGQEALRLVGRADTETYEQYFRQIVLEQ
ncbi:thiol-disulfide isomerase/thioredoxin [Evansella vedderi]|uniref:Thiol-disulfide isomerase/thioredoxin n=1 Tax=Evansella vedderi TaxID=38282 RepID=A0ABT9ZZ74_9BACI|nr:thioredoxin family protein [Evansella vedderi]MDQ0256549.1 thiol-disulfide isomerase/thioredoxin [Evansella vedderi]